MTEAELKAVIIEALGRVAPELVAASLDPKRSFRDQLDIDSIDFLNYALALEAALGFDIPEVDYPRLSNLEGALAYLSTRIPERHRSS